METFYIILIACLLAFIINIFAASCEEEDSKDCQTGAGFINLVIFAVAGYFVYQNYKKK